MIGPEVKLTIEQSLPGNLSMEDWQVMREIVEAVKQALPVLTSRSLVSFSNTSRISWVSECSCSAAAHRTPLKFTVN